MTKHKKVGKKHLDLFTKGAEAERARVARISARDATSHGEVRRIRVQLDFTVDVPGSLVGVPRALESVAWLDVIAHGLDVTEDAWEGIDSVHRGTRKLTYLGDPRSPDFQRRRPSSGKGRAR